MSDLHVVSLRYRLFVDEQYGRFENPPPLEVENDAYQMRLEDGVLSVVMKEHYATVGAARQRVENDLKAWELSTALERDHAWLTFEYDSTGTRIVARSLPPGSVCVAAGAIALGAATAQGSGMCSPPVFQDYPKPPAAFAATVDIEVMILRYSRAVFDEPQML
jgi:hypothetical protein